MYSTLEALIDRLDTDLIHGPDVIPWACPVPVFGDLESARVATLGINPSNQEFTDKAGKELNGESRRRFPTLNSWKIGSWSKAEKSHRDEILDSCRNYFRRNPYRKWFDPLDAVLRLAGASYYGKRPTIACHLDLVPYATGCKWSCLGKRQQQSLMDISPETIGVLLRDSPVRTLILNGTAVVKGFRKITGLRLDSEEMSGWLLRPESKKPVPGSAFKGVVNTLSGIELGREIVVLGFNHNIYGSHGIPNEVRGKIGKWVAQNAGDAPVRGLPLGMATQHVERLRGF